MTASLAASPLKVTLNGFDPRAQTRLVMFLYGPAQGICDVVLEEQAEAAIFDLDGVGGERQWQRFRERFHGPAVVMSVGEKRLPNALWVRKPISVDDFLVAIELIQQRLQCQRFLSEIDQAAKWALPAATLKQRVPVRPAPGRLVSVPPVSALPELTPPELTPPELTPSELTPPELVGPVSAPLLLAPPVSVSPACESTLSVSPPDMPVSMEHCRSPGPRLIDRVTAKACGDPKGAGRAAGLTWTEQQVHETCGTMDEALYLDPERRSELYYEPEEHLQGLLREACKRAKEMSHPVKLELGGQTMIVLAGGRQVFTDLREQRLRPLSVMPTARRSASLQDLNDDELPQLLPADPRLHRRETMLWMISLWASRGRVPKGTDLDAPVSLASWPSFSRLLIPPHAMQIVALWTTRPQSLMQTAKLLAIPHRYVFALYSACLAHGLIERTVAAKAVTTPQSDEMPAPAEQHGLLGRLLRKLRFV